MTILTRRNKYLTLAWLKQRQACQPARDAFVKMFGDRMEITRKNLQRLWRKRDTNYPVWLVERTGAISEFLEAREAMWDRCNAKRRKAEGKRYVQCQCALGAQKLARKILYEYFGV